MESIIIKYTAEIRMKFRYLELYCKFIVYIIISAYFMIL